MLRHFRHAYAAVSSRLRCAMPCARQMRAACVRHTGAQARAMAPVARDRGKEARVAREVHDVCDTHAATRCLRVVMSAAR